MPIKKSLFPILIIISSSFKIYSSEQPNHTNIPPLIYTSNTNSSVPTQNNIIVTISADSLANKNDEISKLNKRNQNLSLHVGCLKILLKEKDNELAKLSSKIEQLKSQLNNESKK